jgi:hypothetical protein
VTASSQAAAPSTNGTPATAAEPQQTKKRKAAAGDEDADSSRPPRRRAEAASGGSSMWIIVFLLFGAFVLVGALVVGVIILVAVTRPADPNVPVAGELDKKKAPDIFPMDGPKKDDPPPVKNDPLPPNTLEGSGVLQSKLLIKPGVVYIQQFRVKAGHAASFRASPVNAGAGNVRLKVNVVKPTDDKFVYAADEKQPSAAPTVNFTLDKTEVVLLRVHNVGTVTTKVSIIYDVSP